MRSPILLVVFNRPDTTEQVFAAIREARPPRLYVAADGPRPDREGEAEQCARTREIASAVDWPCEVKTLFRKRNLGCRMAVSSAISWFFANEPEGIVMEDDVLPHPDFFPFCDILLEYYRDTPQVMQITGNNFQLGACRGDASYYFSHFNHIWGWASWARAWSLCDMGMPGFRTFMLREFPEKFDLPPDAVSHFFSQFCRIDRGQLSSWAYSWQYCHFVHGGLSVTPNHALTRNIGFSGGGTHCLSDSLWAYTETAPLSWPLTHPASMVANTEADKTAYGTVWRPGGISLESLLKLGVAHLNGKQPSANRELVRMARAFYGNSSALDELESVSLRLEGSLRTGIL